MSELRKYFHSLIRNADECGADRSSIQMDLGGWRACLSVQRKSGFKQEGGGS